MVAFNWRQPMAPTFASPSSLYGRLIRILCLDLPSIALCRAFEDVVEAFGETLAWIW
jgi:hypothetical protein